MAEGELALALSIYRMVVPLSCINPTDSISPGIINKVI